MLHEIDTVIVGGGQAGLAISYASRARRKMPLPLTLSGNYSFTWHEVTPGSDWYALSIEVTRGE